MHILWVCLLILAATPLQGCYWSGGLSPCLYVPRNVLISQEARVLLAARLTDNLRREAKKSATRLKTQVSFRLSSFLPSLLVALWHPIERQLAQTTSLPHGDEEVEGEMGERSARGAQLEGGIHRFSLWVRLTVVKRGKRGQKNEVTALMQSKKRHEQSCARTSSFSLLCCISPFGLSPTHTAIYSNICMVQAYEACTL